MGGASREAAGPPGEERGGADVVQVLHHGGELDPRGGAFVVVQAAPAGQQGGTEGEGGQGGNLEQPGPGHTAPPEPTPSAPPLRGRLASDVPWGPGAKIKRL